MQTHSAASVRKEIQERLWLLGFNLGRRCLTCAIRACLWTLRLQQKMNRFVSARAEAEDELYFFRPEDVRKKSANAMQRYTHKGRLSLLAVAQSFEEQQQKEAMQLVDRDRLAAMKEERTDESLNKSSNEASRRRRRRPKRCGWLCQLLKCVGRVSVWHAQGYSRMISTMLGFNFGYSGGAGSTALQSLVQGVTVQRSR